MYQHTRPILYGSVLRIWLAFFETNVCSSTLCSTWYPILKNVFVLAAHALFSNHNLYFGSFIFILITDSYTICECNQSILVTYSCGWWTEYNIHL